MKYVKMKIYTSALSGLFPFPFLSNRPLLCVFHWDKWDVRMKSDRLGNQRGVQRTAACFFHFTIHFQRNPAMYCEKKNQWRHRGWQTRTGWHRKHGSLHHLDVGELKNSQGVSKSFASPTFLAATLDTCLVPVFYSQISDLRNARLVQLRALSVLSGISEEGLQFC